MKHLLTTASLRAVYDMRTEPEAARLLAKALWMTLLLVAALLAAAFLAFGVWLLLWSLGSLETGTADVRQTAPTLDRQSLHATLEELGGRSGRFEELKGVNIQLADPAR